MRQYIPVITLALLGAFALAALSGVLLPSDNVVHAQNSPPDIPENVYTLEVAENTPPGTNIGQPISATDTDGDTLTYSLGGTDEASFDIDPSTGQLLTKADLDAEDQNRHTVEVTVTDKDSDTVDDSATVNINVTDVNERPLEPAAPTVTSGSNAETLEVRWDAPANPGRESITGYDVQYKKVTDTDFSVPSNASGLTYTISSLDAGVDYHVRVRAKNTDVQANEGPWSLVGTGETNGADNTAPTFTIQNTTLNVPENTPTGQNVGPAVRATDNDSTTLVYSLEGQDADSFDIISSSGQILTKVALNREAKAQYTVLVKVVDGDGGSAVASLTISVRDLEEPPSAPGIPTVAAGEDDESTDDADESTTTLKVSWDAPDNTGPPITGQDNTSYVVQYREGDSGDFTQVNTDIDYENRSVKIVDLDPGTSYQVRVMADNDEGEGPWSRTGTGPTNAANSLPEFSDTTATRSVAENTGANSPISSRVSATDRDGDSISYSLEGDPAASFDINEATGQLLTKAALNYEAACGDGNTGSPAEVIEQDANECTYSVTVKATDDNGGEATISVTIEVTDVGERPSAPDMPTVTSVADDANTADVDESTTKLNVSWDEPENMGPSITRYEVQYRNRGTFLPVSDADINMADRTATIADLTENTEYEVQVRATNAEGTGLWSASGRGSTNTEGNSLPSFSDQGATRTIAENTPPNNDVIGGAITATDGDNDPLTYSLEGADRVSFDIDTQTGQIKTETGVTYNFEAKETYSELTVKVSDSEGGSATIDVTITVTDVENEAPLKPDAPAVTRNEDVERTKTLDESTTTLDVSWNAPVNNGPEITKYDLQYRIKDSRDTFTEMECIKGDSDQDKAKCFDDRELTLTELEDGTTYEVLVEATNPEGTSALSDPGNGTTVEANNRPEFSSGTSATRSVAENTQSGRDVVGPVAATDRDAQRLTYSLGGPGADSFTISSQTAQIRTSAALDHESRHSYSVTVKADDGTGTRNSFAAISVTIMVTDVGEAPLRPAAPTVTGISGSSTSLRVMWEAPDNMGPPITDFNVQYRAGNSGPFRDWPHFGMDTSTIITGLSAGTTYHVQVQAHNLEGGSEWSQSGPGSPDPDPANNLPVYTGGVRNFTVEENSAGGVNIGTPVEATDPDRDSLTYSLEGADSALFEIVSASGQIQTIAGVDYNYEAPTNSYSVTVRAADDRGGSATVAVTIAVTDSGVDEPPETPGAPTVEATSNSSTSIDVSWTAPQNPGPRITDYDYQYKETSSSSWTVVDNTTITRTSATISSLDPNTSYDVQVRARNADGMSGWSGTGTGSTSEPVANRAPVFSEGASTTRTVSETAQASSRIGAPVAATDADNDTLIYSLEGTDASSFDITSSAGQILVGAGTVLDASTKSTYSVTVVANDGTVTTTIDVTITVVAVLNVTPSVPDAPTVAPNADSATSLDVTWVAPANQGPPITDYDYRYAVESNSLFKFWTTEDDTAITDTMVTIRNLTTGTSYEVQVRATNSIGTTGWSDSGIGTPEDTGANNPPEFSLPSVSRVVAENTPAGTDISDPVSATDDDQDDTLTYSLSGLHAASFSIDEGTGQLMTSAALDYEVRSSYIVTVMASDGRDSAEIQVTINVTNMYLGCSTQDAGNIALTNDCEALLESKDALEGTTGSLNWAEARAMSSWTGVGVNGSPMRVRWIVLRGSSETAGSKLNGTIPASLSRLNVLNQLNLHSNELSGSIPDEIGDLTNLQKLLLHNNMLTGDFPDLSRLSNLTHLWLSGTNHSVGTGRGIPAWLNGLTNLVELNLWGNEMGGTIPNLSGLSNLRLLKIQNNSLTGSIPAWFGNMNSLSGLYLHFNDLTGEIPSELGQMATLRRLWLDRNQLTGTIPPELGNMSNLGTLNLHTNRLTGNIPTELGNLSKLQHIGFHNNELSGTIPAVLGDLSELTRLAVSNNRLTGTIPSELGLLDKLTLLWLSQNQLSGDIPSQLGDLGDTLTRLRLGGVQNKDENGVVISETRGNTGLTGCVPQSLRGATDPDDLRLGGSAGLSICSN